MLLKITIDPDPGYAVKDFFYTYNEKTNSLYAIFPKYPVNKKLVLKNMEIQAGTTIRFLSTKETLPWKQDGNNIEISLPEYNPDRIKTPEAYVIKIENYGRFIAKPQIKVSYKPGALKPVVTINTDPGTTVFYTLDGSAPGPQSVPYKSPFSVDSSCTVRAIAKIDPGAESRREISGPRPWPRSLNSVSRAWRNGAPARWPMASSAASRSPVRWHYAPII